MKMKQHDIVTLKARVELVVPHGVQIVVVGPNGSDVRTQVATDQILTVEPGPLTAGDAVMITKGKKGLDGIIKHRAGEHAWVEWTDGTQSVEAVAALSR